MLTKRNNIAEKGADFSNMTQMEALLAFRNSFTQDEIEDFVHNMEEIENISDLIVARSGAMTITEIANLAKPSVLIPLPNVSNNHQMYNAKILEKLDAAKIIKNNELTGEKLNEAIESIILDKQKCIKMGENAYKVSNHNSTEKIYEEIKKLVK